MSAAGMPSLAELIEATQSLPALSPVAVDLLKSMNAQDADVNELARRIALDQAIAARVLRVANSPFYGLSGRIATIHDAIVVLGFSTVRSLVMAFALKGVFPVEPDSGFDARRFWRHSLGVAVCAQALARALRRNAEALFIAGLLHDIGHLAMVVVAPQVFQSVSEESERSDIPMFSVERALLGYDHATLGAALARRWNFPAEVVTAIGFHHTPDEGEPTVMSDPVHYANVLVHALLPGDAPHEPEEPVSPRVVARLALDQRAIARVMERAEEHFSSLEPLFD